jgi:hypothetical protein
MEPTVEYFLPPDVILVTVADGSARLLDMAGSFHAVPKIGARMLEETLTSGAAAAAARVADDYGWDWRAFPSPCLVGRERLPSGKRRMPTFRHDKPMSRMRRLSRR